MAGGSALGPDEHHQDAIHSADRLPSGLAVVAAIVLKGQMPACEHGSCGLEVEPSVFEGFRPFARIVSQLDRQPPG